MKHMEAQNNLAQNAKALMLDWSGTRKQMQFWLRLDKTFDLEVFGIIEWFKSKGLFRGSVMTGLRVMFAYYHNDIEGIKRELPNLEGMIGQVTPPAPPDNTDLLNEILRNQKLILERGITAELPPSPIAAKPTGLQPMTGGLKPIGGAKPLAMPAFDDDDELPALTTKKNTSIDSAATFINAMFGLAH